MTFTRMGLKLTPQEQADAKAACATIAGSEDLGDAMRRVHLVEPILARVARRVGLNAPLKNIGLTFACDELTLKTQ